MLKWDFLMPFSFPAAEVKRMFVCVVNCNSPSKGNEFSDYHSLLRHVNCSSCDSAIRSSPLPTGKDLYFFAIENN